MAMSDWLEQQLASHIFGTGTLPKPGTLAFALCTGVPSDHHTGATLPELPNAGGYARQALAPSADNWQDPVSASGLTRTHKEVLFPEASADWGWVSGVALVDSATHGAGNVWFHGPLNAAKFIGQYDRFLFPSGNYTVTFS